jgi:hypothetical protein
VSSNEDEIGEAEVSPHHVGINNVPPMGEFVTAPIVADGIDILTR